MKLALDDYQAIVRQDPYAFIERAFYALNPTTNFMPNWHLEVIASELEKCRRGETRRLIINISPRSLKSHCSTVAFPAYLLGHDPTAQIICASYGQDLANKHASDCRTILTSPWYRSLFPGTRLSSQRQAIQEFTTTRSGVRLSTSIGGVLTGRGADYIIIDDPLKPDEALSETQRKAVNDWFDHTLYSRLNDKRRGCIIIVMQRLHEDDLVGHVVNAEPWRVIRFPAIAETDETHTVQTLFGTRRFQRRAGEALHPEREPLEVLNRIREILGEYNFAGQYQQAPAPLGGGLVKAEWFKTYAANEVPAKFEMVLQSWDTANKPTELSDYSVCTTWGIKDKHLYLLHVYRKRVDYPELKRAVRVQANAFSPQTILIEDKASGTQLIQEFVGEGLHAVKQYQPTMDKIMRMNSVTSTIENGFVNLPEKAAWLGEYLHELATFPNGKFDDQADSTSQALDWLKSGSNMVYGLLDWWRRDQKREESIQQSKATPESMVCPRCNGNMNQKIPNGLRCMNCGEQWPPPGSQKPVQFTRADFLSGRIARGRTWRWER